MCLQVCQGAKRSVKTVKEGVLEMRFGEATGHLHPHAPFLLTCFSVASIVVTSHLLV